MNNRVVRRLGQKVTLDSLVSNGVAAEFLCIHPTTLIKLCERGIVPHTRRILRRPEGERIFSIRELVQFAQDRCIVTNPGQLVESLPV